MGQIIAMVQAVGPEQRLYEYGVLGIIVVVLSFVISKVAQRFFNVILTDRDKATSQRDVLVEDYFTKVLPAITKNTDVLQNRQDLDRELIAAFKAQTEALDKNREVLQEVKMLLTLSRGNPQTGGN